MSLPQRDGLFSLRQEFPTIWSRLQHSPANTPVKLSIADKHLPIFLRNRNIHVTKAALLLRTPSSQSLKNLSITVDGTMRTGGTCSFAIPEVFFDLFYPGQYRLGDGVVVELTECARQHARPPVDRAGASPSCERYLSTFCLSS